MTTQCYIAGSIWLSIVFFPLTGSYEVVWSLFNVIFLEVIWFNLNGLLLIGVVGS